MKRATTAIANISAASRRRLLLTAALVLLGLVPEIHAHGVSGKDALFLQSLQGLAIGPLMYLGAKHMVTGYDHLAFLVGVVFFLYRLKDIVAYVSLFTVGHSITLLFGVLGQFRVDPYLIDAIIGVSVVYKAFDNIDGFRSFLGFQPDARAAVFIFGLFHGLGLATKLQEFSLSPTSLVGNMLSFNVGVEIGQAIALVFVVTAIALWRTSAGFNRLAVLTNGALMGVGLLLVAYQMSSYFLQA